MLLDDGELADVRAILDDLGVEYVDETPDTQEPSPAFENSRLVISTSKHSPRAADLCAASTRRILMEILEHDSPAPDTVAEARCDFIVRRPVHAAALKLLIQRVLYTGPERRGRERVAIGAAVTLRSGIRSWVSTLLDLSLRSCRLLSSKPVVRDRTVTVRLPRRITGGETLSLSGRVVRSEEPSGDGFGMFEIAVSFDSIEPATRRALRVILEGSLVGPASLVSEPASNPRSSSRTGALGGKVAGTRMFDRRIEARQSESGLPATARVNPGTLPAVLIGRDLSPAGMRIERDGDLEVGDELDLLLHGGAPREPIAVKATVERINEAGCFLRFRDVGTAEAARIEALVDALIVTERPAAASSRSNKVVISEVVAARLAG